NIDRWLDGLSGLTNLERVRLPAGIDDGAASSDRGAQLGGELIEHLEILRRAEPAPAADDDRGILELGTARFFLFAAKHPGDRPVGRHRVCEGLDLRCGRRLCRLGINVLWTNQDQG